MTLLGYQLKYGPAQCTHHAKEVQYVDLQENRISFVPVSPYEFNFVYRYFPLYRRNLT